MVKIIMGLQGMGKTKQIIEICNTAAAEEDGSVVCIERGDKLTYDVNYAVRLIDVAKYPITSYERLKAFICGLYSGNYDISCIIVDSLFKVAKSDSIEEFESFLDWVTEFGRENNIKFTFSVSADQNLATEKIKKYF